MLREHVIFVREPLRPLDMDHPVQAQGMGQHQEQTQSALDQVRQVVAEVLAIQVTLQILVQLEVVVVQGQPEVVQIQV